MTRIMGIMISDRMTEASALQKVLTDNGCIIKTRLGLHEVTDKNCSRKGLLILELIGTKDDWNKLESEAKAIQGIEVKYMDFEL